MKLKSYWAVAAMIVASVHLQNVKLSEIKQNPVIFP
jgi:hypothetical protein